MIQSSNIVSTSVSAATSKTFTGLSAGTYSVKVTQASGGCDVQTSSVNLTLPTFTTSLESTGATTICYGASTTLKVTMTGGTSPYLLTLSNGQTVTNYTSGSNITVAPGSGTTITVSSATDANSCMSSSNSGSVTITVNPITVISSQSTAGQTKCINGSFTSISVTANGAGTLTYQWYSNTSASNSGGTLITGATNASYTPSAASAGTLYYYCVVTGTCGTATSDVSEAFVVSPNNTVALTSGSGTDNQTVCVGNAITNITYSTAGATGATLSGLPPGVSGSWNSNVVTISGTPTASGNSTYTVTLTGGCGTVATSGTITVKPLVHTNKITKL